MSAFASELAEHLCRTSLLEMRRCAPSGKKGLQLHAAQAAGSVCPQGAATINNWGSYADVLNIFTHLKHSLYTESDSANNSSKPF